MTKDLTFVSTYSGCGGLDLGFCEAGFEPVWANDIDPDAVATYNSFSALTSNGHRAVAGDIRSQDIPRRGAAKLVVGGPPCQGFSVAGRMDPNDPRSKHVWDFMGVVRRIQPEAFVMENVKALAINRRWSDLRNALVREASNMGYETRLFLLDSSHFGVPQARERMFLMGVRGGNKVSIRPVTEDQPPSVRHALGMLPPFGQDGNDSICSAKITPAKKPVMRKSPFAGMLFNGQGRPLDLDRPALTLPASMGGNRTPIVDQYQIDHGGESWVVGYHAHLAAGGEPVQEVPKRLRRITVEEAAALQTFPKEASWSGSQSAQYRQIGNAVPPRLAFHVAEAVKRALQDEAVVLRMPPATDSVRDLTPDLAAAAN